MISKDHLSLNEYVSISSMGSVNDPSIEECESIVNDYLNCLISHKSDRSQCTRFEPILDRCGQGIQAISGAPPDVTYCKDQMFEYSKCAIHLNTSLCANEYKILHECKIRRRRFLFGEDLGLISMNPQARKKW